LEYHNLLNEILGNKRILKTHKAIKENGK